MGTWGTGLYSNDTTCDVRDSYLDYLRKGLSEQEAADALLKEYEDCFGDVEEEPLVWFALAETQWKYGHLDEQIKQKALEWLDREEELTRWYESDTRYAKKWKQTRDLLKEKLCSPLPKKKQVKGYRSFHCDWKLGAVYAYQLKSDFSQEKGVYGQYIAFRKVSERKLVGPEDLICPEVEVFNWMGDSAPDLEDIRDRPILPMIHPEGIENARKLYSFVEKRPLTRDEILEKEKRVVLIRSSFRDRLRKSAIYVGCYESDDLEPFCGKQDVMIGHLTSFAFESGIIERWLSWNEMEKETL